MIIITYYTDLHYLLSNQWKFTKQLWIFMLLGLLKSHNRTCAPIVFLTFSLSLWFLSSFCTQTFRKFYYTMCCCFCLFVCLFGLLIHLNTLRNWNPSLRLWLSLFLILVVDFLFSILLLLLVPILLLILQPLILQLYNKLPIYMLVRLFRPFYIITYYMMNICSTINTIVIAIVLQHQLVCFM